MSIVLLITLFSSLLAFFVIGYTIWVVTGGSKKKTGRKPFDLIRGGNNPILSPQMHRDWEAEGAFNPGAVLDHEGNVHLFYRAIGRDGISRVGHALSHDGRNIEDRTMYPVYEPQKGSGLPLTYEVPGPHHFDRLAHISGGGWGGSEDPRVTKIGDRIYMTYTAFEGWHNMRIGLTSISVDDMVKGRWKWKRPTLISPKGARAKNWVFFPEKINGKYAILHGIAPQIFVAYVDHPEMIPNIKSSRDHGGYGIHDNSRKGYWDEVVKGAGTPPIKTDIGWLLLYHAIHEGKYKVGAMILDLLDPTKVLYRSPQPILAPDMHYENDGKCGVVYATGAVVKDGKLFVYYGGGDKHSCVAETQLGPLLSWLMNYGKV